MMESLLLHILSVVYAILGLMVVQITIFFVMTSERGGFVRLLPKINNYAKRGIYELKVKLQKPRKLKNMGGVAVVPDVDDVVLRKFARVLLREIEQSVNIEDVKLTETVWLVGGKFKELIGGSPAQFRACMDRLEANRIITRSGGKDVRVWAMPYRSITSKLQRLLK